MRLSHSTMYNLVRDGDTEAAKMIRQWNLDTDVTTEAHFAPEVGFFLFTPSLDMLQFTTSVDVIILEDDGEID